MTATRSPTRTTRWGVGALFVAVSLVASCDIVSPSRGPKASGSHDLVIGVVALPLLDDLDADVLTDHLIYNGLYRFDNAYRVQPDLADGPCLVGADQLTLTCHLREASFHDGSALSAEDVVFSYQLASSAACRSAPLCLHPSDTISRIDAPNERTVVFVLREPDPGLAADLLPRVPIEPQAITMAAYTAFAAKAARADTRAMDELARAMKAEPDRSDALCERDRGTAERLLAAAGAIVVDPLEFTTGGAFQACAYSSALADQLESVVASVESVGVDAIAAAYPVLGLHRHPVGTGPWRVVSRIPGQELALEAFEGYHFGRPKVDRVRVVAIPDEGAAVDRFASGTLDWWPGARGPFGIRLGELPNVTLFDYPILVDIALQYNLRDGRLFSDLNLRKALELCIDKKGSVDAATNGVALVASSAIPPPSWAHKDEPILDRNVAEAKQFIESSGWRLGADGIYAKEGQYLEAQVVVVKPDPVRGPFSVMNFLDLLVTQTRDCGMDLTPYPVPSDDVVEMIDNYPHHIPDAAQAFDLYLGGRSLPEDPNDPTWESAQISSPDQPRGLNYMGFSDPRVDEVLAAARVSTNIDERTRLYGTFQDIVFEQRAMLFAYSRVDATALSDRVVTGGRPPESEYWWWQLETLTLAD